MHESRNAIKTIINGNYINRLKLIFLLKVIFIFLGDKKYKVLKVNPIDLPLLDTDLGRDLTMRLTNLHVTGMENVEIKSLK